MFRHAALAAALLALATPAFAQPADSVEVLASDTEAAGVRATLALIDCEAGEIEKESDNLFEVDDAICGIGQYDIKLDAEFSIISMTRDE